MSSKSSPVTLANRNPFTDRAFLREFAATRARHAFPTPISRPEPPAPRPTGRKTFDTRMTNRPELAFPMQIADDLIL